MSVRRLGMSQLAKDAGFGTRIWSEAGYWGGRFYHLIVAAGTGAVLVASSVQHVSPLILAGWLAGYGLYLLVRFYFIAGQREAAYYQPLPQFVRAQIAMGLLTLVIAWLGEAGTRGYLWLLYSLQLMIIGRHLSTGLLLACILEVWVMLAGLRLMVAPWRTVASFIQTNPDLVVQWAWIALIGFVLHYLLRNIEARDGTIAVLSEINRLADRRQVWPELGARWEVVLGTYLRNVGGRCGSVWLCNQRTGEIRPLTTLGRRLGQSCLVTDPNGEGEPITIAADHPVAEVVRTGRPLYCRRQATLGDRLSRTHGAVRVYPLPPDIQGRILVPIGEGDSGESRVLGVLSIDFDRANPPREPLLDHYFEFLGDMARWVMPILKFIQQVEEDQTLHRLGVQVGSSLHLQDVLDDTLDALTGPLGFELATISLVDEEAQLIRCVAGRNVPAEWVAQACHPLDSNDIQADVVRRGEMEVIQGWDERFDRRIYKRFHHEQLIRAFVPIRRQTGKEGRPSKVQGVVEVGYHLRTQAQIAPDQLAMLEALMDQVAVAIEQARLFESTERHRELLAQLHQVSHKIASARYPDQVLKTLGEALQRVLAADIVMIYRYDRGTRTIEPPRVFGEVWGRRPLRLPPLDRGVVAEILHTGRPYYAPDAPDDPLLSEPYPPLTEGEKPGARRTFTLRQNIKSFAGVPMLVNGEALGVLCVNYRRRHAFG